MTRRLACLTLALLVAGCAAPDPAGPTPATPDGMVEIPDADLRVLFIGNSLTYTHDLPAVVQALADAAGLSFAHATLARPGWSLEEHWGAGAADVIGDVRADVVVLQQGPSSLPASQVHLAAWTERFAPVIREAGGRPALLMVWPDRGRAAAFPDVDHAYTAAATAVGGLLIPAGRTWVRAGMLDPELELWGPDGFHPSYAGTLAAAMAGFAVLTGTEAPAVPDLPEDAASESAVATLRTALAAALE